MSVLRCGALVLVVLVTAGCGPRAPDVGPKVDSFVGQVVQNDKPVSFPAEEKVQVQLFHEKGQSFGIPINSDGTFKIGWMPIGKYSAMLKREKTLAKGAAPSAYSVPGGLTIQEGQTEYKIDLGPKWKP